MLLKLDPIHRLLPESCVLIVVVRAIFVIIVFVLILGLRAKVDKLVLDYNCKFDGLYMF